MAYVSQELKARIAPRIKELAKAYGVKATLAVQNHSTLVLNIKSGSVDFLESRNRIAKEHSESRGIDFYPVKDHIQVNPYSVDNGYDGLAKEFLLKAIEALNDGNWNKSDLQSDYFNVGWYVSINVGKWNKPYELLKD